MILSLENCIAKKKLTNYKSILIQQRRIFWIPMWLWNNSGKYPAQNRATGEIFETPQVAYMMIAATLFAKYPEEDRMKYVKGYYDAISTFKLSLPTPVMAGVRTPQRQFSSCVLIETGDSLDSINATSSAVVKYVSPNRHWYWCR